MARTVARFMQHARFSGLQCLRGNKDRLNAFVFEILV